MTTLWLFNIAMENGPFIDGLPFLKMVIFHGYVSHNQMVTFTQEKSSKLHLPSAVNSAWEGVGVAKEHLRQVELREEVVPREICARRKRICKHERVKPLWIYQGLLLDIPCVYRIYI